MSRFIGIGVIALSLAFFAGTAMAGGGAGVYKSRCLPCHGAEGAGSAVAPAFQGNDFIKKSSKDEIANTIKNGRAGAAKKYKKFALAMPPQKGALSDTQISEVVDYLKSIANK